MAKNSTSSQNLDGMPRWAAARKWRKATQADFTKLASPALPNVAAVLCKNCRMSGHELDDCFGPCTAKGDIDGCPICKDKSHIIDDCKDPRAKIPAVERFLLITKRQGRPPMRTEKYCWIIEAVQAGTTEMSRTLPPAPGKKYDPIDVNAYPWRKSHARKMLATLTTEEWQSQPSINNTALMQRWADPMTKTMPAILKGIENMTLYPDGKEFRDTRF